ncbi:hypothetical protein X975_07653, partial [Stegodyphus mimosarum]
MNNVKEITLYMKPNKKFQDLKEQIEIQCKVPIEKQYLLLNKSSLETQYDSTMGISVFPATSYAQPLMLIHLERTNVKGSESIPLVSSLVSFPPFPD